MKYIVSTYGDENLSLAMYEDNDFRLKSKNLLIEGTFTKNRSIKGVANGHEIGLFTTPSNEIYIVFTDHTVRKPTKEEQIKIDESIKAKV